MKCLNCNSDMLNHYVQTKGQEIAYDLCEGCGSLWLDKGELDRLAFQVAGSIEYSSSSPSTNEGPQPRPCPRCSGENLQAVNFLNHTEIRLDRCPNCEGFWLDGGELDLINRRLEKIMPIEGRGFSDFVNNVHIPYWHKRIVKPSSETDFKVDAPPIKGATLSSETEYECPACASKLSDYKVFGISFEGCLHCKGVFLDAGELRKLKDKSISGTWRDLRWLDDEVEAIKNANLVKSDRRCPKCPQEDLLTTSFGDSTILIDCCRGCHGLWLDHGEFKAIVEQLTDKLMAATSAELAPKVYEEIKEIWSGPENVVSEILDAKAAISALVNLWIFEHPVLSNLMLNSRF